jgi:HK97 family phage major capsid protein
MENENKDLENKDLEVITDEQSDVIVDKLFDKLNKVERTSPISENTVDKNEIGKSLWKVYNKEATEVVLKSTGVEGTANLGGTVAPTTWSNSLYQVEGDDGVARQLCNVVPMTSKAEDFFTGSSLSLYETAEAASFTASHIAFDKVTLTPVKKGGIYIFSKELNEDAVINMQQEAIKNFRYRFAEEEDALLATRIDELPNSSSITASVSGAFTASVTSLDVFAKMLGDLGGNKKAYLKNAIWLMSESVMWYLYTIKRTTNDPMLDFSQPVPRLGGKPIYTCNAMASATDTTSGKTVFALGDFKRFAYFGDRRSVTFELGTQATVGNVNFWTNDCIGILGSERVDIQFIDKAAIKAWKLK